MAVPRIPRCDPAAAILADPQSLRGIDFAEIRCAASRQAVPGEGKPELREGIVRLMRDALLVRTQAEPRRRLSAGSTKFRAALPTAAFDRQSHNRWVVLKGLLNSNDADAMAAAEAEVRTLTKVEHPNIERIYNFVDHPSPRPTMQASGAGRAARPTRNIDRQTDPMWTVGPELSVDLFPELFPQATWTATTVAPVEFPEYPGARPTGSWRLTPNGWLYGVDAVGDGWQDRATGEMVDLSGRHLLLAYGSNPDPGKLLSRPWLFGGDDVIALRAVVFGWAAAWCDARRQADGSVIATLVRAPGRAEVHPVLMVTDHQLGAMDEWEGHPRNYRREDHVGPVLLESGQWAGDVQVYLGTAEQRPALLRGGRPLLCAEVSRADADALVAL